MSTSLSSPDLPPPYAAPPPSERLQRMERFIDDRIEKTSSQLKLVDLAGAIMTLFGGALAYLLMLALIDHWVMPLGFWGRLLSLVALLGTGGWYLFTRVSNLVMRRINPVYAAQTIEESTPSLKNSLINFLLFRGNRSTVRSVVYEAVEQQAASNLSHVNIDAAVDRSRLIRTGYILAGIMFVCAVYAVLSPKNPLQTVARVFAPWSNLTPPTRVRITDVRPGDIDIYQGRSVEISAVVRGIDEDEPVTLFFTTADKQFVNEPIPMTLDDDSYAHRCEFSPDGEGVQQNVVYRIGAGDATSGDFEIRVRPAPSILVREVQYDYPAYTGLPRKVVRNGADVQAVEGTMVTIRAAANLPIEQARLELMPSATDDGVTPEPLPLAMKADDKEAVARFRLSLLPDRLTPRHYEYLVGFRTADGERSPSDVRHRIQVVPDLAPEIEILTPMKREIEIPVNGKQQFEVRALDPDFGLSRVTLHAARGGRKAMTETLLLDEKGKTGQVIRKQVLAPKKLGLVAGDELVVWASSEDNRADAKTGSPLPNSVRTGNYLVRVTAAEEFPRRPEDAETESESASGGNPEDQKRPSQDESAGGESNDPRQDGDSTSDGDLTAAGQEDQATQGDQPENADNGGNTGSESNDAGKPDQAESTDAGNQNADGGEKSSSGDPGSGEANSSEGDNGGTETTDRPANLDGSEDGDIIEQLNQHRRERDDSESRDQAPENPGSEGGEGDPNAETNPRGQDHSQSGAGSSTEENLGGPKDPNASGDPNGPSQDQNNTPNNRSSDGSNSGDSGDQEKSSGDQDNPGTAGQRQDGAEQTPKSDGGQQQTTGADGQKRGDDQSAQENTGGTGGQPQGGDQPKQDGSEKGGGENQSESGGQGDNSKSGAGQESEQKEGSPGSQEGNQQRTGEQKSDNPSGNPKDGEGGQSPATNPKSSDSAGADDGDKKGGGKQGGGQSAEQAGNDSAGSTSAGDEGGAPANEPGDGPTGDDAGGGRPSERPTGNPGGEDGPGSSTRPNPDGSNAGDAPGASPSRSNDGPRNDSPSTGPPADESGQGGGEGGLDRGQGAPLGGGEPSGDPVAESGGAGGGLPGDRLKRAKEETVLALEHLQHMSEEEVRDATGHSKKDLENWAERYRSMLREAEQPGNVDAKHKLDNELQGLGLTPRRSESRGGTATDDSNFGDREKVRSEPPAKYKELFDAYRKSG
jgi:hypothetical protein